MSRYDPLFPNMPRLPSLEEQLLSHPANEPADTRVIDYLRSYGNAPTQPGFLSRIYARLTRRNQHK